MKVHRASVLYGAMGFIMALGAPAGWLLWRTQGVVARVRSELADAWPLYVYLLVGTATAFVLFGALLGRRFDRLSTLVSSLRSAAIVDPLTKLKNRRYFNERLVQELARARRDGRRVALIVGDLDHFKEVNDHYGHIAGDLTLLAVADVITASCRVGDSACRIGGEEFAIILPATDLLEAARVAERVRTNVGARVVNCATGDVRPTISLGLAVSDPTHADADALFAAADNALYRAKAHGRNRTEMDDAIDPATALGCWHAVRSKNVDA